jgi:transcriptional regulator with XRE-family HTH domain
MEVPKEIVENTIIDWKKKEIHPVDRADLIRTYMQEYNLSQRDLCNLFGISKSTLHGWLQFSRLSKEEYGRVLSKGYTKSEISTLLKENTKLRVSTLFPNESVGSRRYIDEETEKKSKIPMIQDKIVFEYMKSFIAEHKADFIKGTCKVYRSVIHPKLKENYGEEFINTEVKKIIAAFISEIDNFKLKKKK